MGENRNLVWALGAIALVILVGAFVLALGGQPGGQPGAQQTGLSSVEAMKQGNDLYGRGSSPRRCRCTSRLSNQSQETCPPR